LIASPGYGEANFVLTRNIILTTLPRYGVNDPFGWFQLGKFLIRLKQSILGKISSPKDLSLCGKHF
jgi:hypothetical protein